MAQPSVLVSCVSAFHPPLTSFLSTFENVSHELADPPFARCELTVEGHAEYDDGESGDDGIRSGHQGERHRAH